MGTLKRVVIKEELLELTGDVVSAVILNQMLYWSERCRDADAFLREEQERQGVEVELRHGWIYKSAPDLADEIMLGVSESTVRRRLEELVEAGFLDRREGPHKWSNTLEYRPNVYNIQRALFDIGYVLDGYPLQFQFDQPDASKPQPDASISQSDASISHSDVSINHSDVSTVHGDGSTVHGDGTVSETTTETTTEITGRGSSAAAAARGEVVAYRKMVHTYEQAAGPISPLVGEQLTALADDCEERRLKLPDGAEGADVPGPSWVSEAIREAGAAGARVSVNYVKAIIDRWLREGFKSKFGGGNGRGNGRAAGVGGEAAETSNAPSAAQLARDRELLRAAREGT